MFETTHISKQAIEVAPDGSQVRPLLRCAGGSMAHYTLEPGKTSLPVVHKTVDELWSVTAGRGELWRRCQDQEMIVTLEKGVCVSILTGVAFQFRALGAEPLEIVAVTLPPWPGAEEAQHVHGCKSWVPVISC
jgi:mannose-6-phosphate isomerase-like protein (cupin superfamily)